MPKKNLAAYRRMASKSGKVWMEHGALAYFECVGDDLTPEGVVATFPRTVKAKPAKPSSSPGSSTAPVRTSTG